MIIPCHGKFRFVKIVDSVFLMSNLYCHGDVLYDDDNELQVVLCIYFWGKGVRELIFLRKWNGKKEFGWRRFWELIGKEGCLQSNYEKYCFLLNFATFVRSLLKVLSSS